jgi:hypothetical protein
MIDDKELIRRALLGDQKAQQECTEKWIVLPCPKCFGDGVKIKGDGHDIYDPDTLGYIDSIPDSILYVTCDNCNLCSNCITVEDGEEREDAEKRLIAEWNTRPAPPIGKCGECALWKEEKECPGAFCCTITGMERESNDFCSEVEPKEK